jgi:hypothetical protein
MECENLISVKVLHFSTFNAPPDSVIANKCYNLSVMTKSNIHLHPEFFDPHI